MGLKFTTEFARDIVLLKDFGSYAREFFNWDVECKNSSQNIAQPLATKISAAFVKLAELSNY